MLDWQQINTVFLDMDGTLLDLHFDNYFWLQLVPEYFASKNNLSLAATKTYITQKTQAKYGQLDWYCIDYWSGELGLDILKLKTKAQYKIKLRPNAKKLLQYLQQNNKRVVLVTNAHPDTLELKICRVNLAKFFNNIISAHNLGLAKEELGFWQKLQQIESFDIQHTLFIDDSASVLTAAKNYGFKYLFGISYPDLLGAKSVYQNFTALDDFTQIVL